ncbi:MAG: riboflavin kinase [Candidatus Parcubacteria bacterium]|nr:riboflavin kinase [Candidatus Parcubacteria bacterium]
MTNTKFPSFSGPVISGAGLGKRMGFATANLDPAVASGLASGLYLVKVDIKGQVFSGLLHHGYNSLQNRTTLEVLIKDFSGDLYGQEITVAPIKKLREVMKFESKEAAAEQIKKDLKWL